MLSAGISMLSHLSRCLQSEHVASRAFSNLPTIALLADINTSYPVFRYHVCHARPKMPLHPIPSSMPNSSSPNLDPRHEFFLTSGGKSAKEWFLYGKLGWLA